MRIISTCFSFLAESIEEFILLGIIILNVLDFFEIISPDLDYVKKIISLAAFAYLFYKISLTRLFFGTRNRNADIILLISYFMLSLKDMLNYSASAISELKDKGITYWATLYPVNNDIKESFIYNITSPLSNISLDTILEIPIQGFASNLTRIFTIQPGLTTNDVLIRVSNNLGSKLYLIEPKFIVHRWHNLLIENIMLLEKSALIIGMLIIFILSIYFTLRMKMDAPSIMHLLEEEGDVPKRLGKVLIRTFFIFTLLSFFYIAVFNLTMEWFTMAIDAPFVTVSVFFYLLLWMKHHKRFSPESFIYKIGNISENLYERFTSLFFTRRGVLLGISAMLVLHLLTDIGNFVVPYTTGLQDSIYFHELGEDHNSLFSLSDLFNEQKEGLLFMDLSRVQGIRASIIISLLYLFNVLAILFMFIGPAYIWYLEFSKKKVTIPKFLLALFYGSLSVYILAPVFSLGRITSDALVGVDITTTSIFSHSTTSFSAILGILGLVMALVFILSYNQRLRNYLMLGAVIAIVLFFGTYILFFSADISAYYILAITGAIRQSSLFIAISMLMFFTMTIIFYIGGFIAYLYICFKS